MLVATTQPPHTAGYAGRYELKVDAVHILDFYGGMGIIGADAYYGATLDVAAHGYHPAGNEERTAA